MDGASDGGDDVDVDEVVDFDLGSRKYSRGMGQGGEKV